MQLCRLLSFILTPLLDRHTRQTTNGHLEFVYPSTLQRNQRCRTHKPGGERDQFVLIYCSACSPVSRSAAPEERANLYSGASCPVVDNQPQIDTHVQIPVGTCGINMEHASSNRINLMLYVDTSTTINRATTSEHQMLRYVKSVRVFLH